MDDLFLIPFNVVGTEAADADFSLVVIAPEFAVFAHHMDSPAHPVGHAGKGKYRCDPVFKLYQRALMIADIVVAAVDAAAVTSLPQSSQNTFLRLVQRQNTRRPGAERLQISFACIKTAILRNRAVQAAIRASIRRIFRFEILQASGRGNPNRTPAGEPEENVHIMAALLHDHRAGEVAVAPVPAHEAVRHMEVPDVFRMVDRDDLPEHAAVEDLFQPDKERRIAQYMADCHAQALFICFLCYLQAFQWIGRNRLFQKQVPASFQPRHRMDIMVSVSGGNNHGICLRDRADHFKRIGKQHTFGRAEQQPRFFQLLRMPVCHSNNFISEHIMRILGINHSARACSDQSQFHKHSLFLLPGFCFVKNAVCFAYMMSKYLLFGIINNE